ncbi:pex2 pex12 amino terminal region protein [Cystoisospora suis]|uniref:RING-type E3 ubiquitin transferase n=1 Tax=Cystoisospora suis TaxID=483139 RepID=A0A2C6KTR0_9APIC|nr:pex2 pex12 amino terminal region protein [Cystoisospora suis]
MLASSGLSSLREHHKKLVAYARQRHEELRREGGRVSQVLPRKTKLLFLLLSILLPYGFDVVQEIITKRYLALLAVLQQRLRRAEFLQRHREQWAARQTDSNRPLDEGAIPVSGDPPTVTLSRDERLLIAAYRVCQALQVLVVLLQVIQTGLFLVNGEFRSLPDWILGLKMEHIAPSLQRNVSLELLQHQLHWQALTQLLVLVLPQLPTHRVLLRQLLRLRKLPPLIRERAAELRLRALSWFEQRAEQLRRQEQQIEHGPPSRQTAAGKVHKLGREYEGSSLQLKSQMHRGRLTKRQAGFSYLVIFNSICRAALLRSLRRGCGVFVRLLAVAPQSEGQQGHGVCSDSNTGISSTGKAFSLADEETDDDDLIEDGPCIFCGKEEIVLPFTGENCKHRFCYWCVASHPQYQASENASTQQGDGNGPAEAEAKSPPAPTEKKAEKKSFWGGDEETLECPVCGEDITRISWAR